MNKPRNTNAADNQSEQQVDLLNLHQFQDSAAFNEAVDRDFDGALAETGDGFSRRRWLQLMGASLALGGVAGCRYEEKQIATFAFRPQNRVPGVPQHYATFSELGGVAEPLLSTTYDGRPIKLDGNPSHNESKGASTTFAQARMLEFYDPDRLRASLHTTDGKAKEVSFEDFVAACKFPSDLSSTAILAEPSSSPSRARLQTDFEAKGGQWYSFAAINDDNSRAGTKQAFGQSVRPHYDLSAKIILTLDADPLNLTPGCISNAISFAKGRDADGGKTMSRLYAIESQFSFTGSAADHRMSVRSSDIPGFVASIMESLDHPVAPEKTEAGKEPTQPYRERVFNALVSDLNAHKGQSVIIAGEHQPPEVHALVHSLNERLGNIGKTVTYTKLDDADRANSMDSITAFAAGLKSGKIKNVVVLGGNPVYNAPHDLNLAELIAAADSSAHVTFYQNETSAACQWVSAVAHPIASWKDGRTYGGSVLVGQPLINPLFGGKSELETLATLMGSKESSGQAIVRETLNLGQKEWTTAVHDGFVKGSAAAPATVKVTNKPTIAATKSWAEKWDNETMEVVFKQDNSIYDGRFANNAWLQELPDFFTKITWDNVAQVSPATAKRLGVTQRGMGAKSMATKMTIALGDATVVVPVAIQPGQADGSVGLSIGYGRVMAGRVGGNVASKVTPVGHDISPLRTAKNWSVVEAGKDAFHSSGTNYKLAIVQEPWAIDTVAREEIQARMFRDESKKQTDRSALIREGTFDSYKAYLKKHPLHHDHKSADVPAAKITPAVFYKTGNNGSLPVMNQVSFTPEEPKTEKPDDKKEDDHHGGSHGWPEAFHMHHQLFDLQKGVRETYKSEDPTLTNIWGKSIDLNKCIGCNSCVIACQSENNIPVVGKAEVWRGRELHWIRIDRYYGDNLYTIDAKDDDKVMVQQPVACHHCENAPCETVCPVAATVHSSEGLNDMVYNRCIGTRYCGNNCPYKVRRFNYLNYSDAVTFIKYPGADKLEKPDLQMQSLLMNPEVSVRSRGVMEKCTYCVQRIQNTKIQAKNERRAIGANEIEVACQVACPTSAIKFGDLNNVESDVRKAHDNPRAYSMLEELNNRPRTQYLARVRNPHEALRDIDDRSSVGGHGGGHEEHAHDDGTKHDSEAKPAEKDH